MNTKIKQNYESRKLYKVIVKDQETPYIVEGEVIMPFLETICGREYTISLYAICIGEEPC